MVADELKRHAEWLQEACFGMEDLLHNATPEPAVTQFILQPQYTDNICEGVITNALSCSKELTTNGS